MSQVAPSRIAPESVSLQRKWSWSAYRRRKRRSANLRPLAVTGLPVVRQPVINKSARAAGDRADSRALAASRNGANRRPGARAAGYDGHRLTQRSVRMTPVTPPLETPFGL